MTQVNINNFVTKGSEDHLLFDQEGYEITVKKLDTKNVAKFHCGHNQIMEIINKYGLKPAWTIWVNQFDQDGKVLANKGKYVLVK